MKKQHTQELKQTQSQLSQKDSASAEVFTVNENKQADRNIEAAKNDSLEANTINLPNQSELNADNIISKTIELDTNVAESGEEISNIISEDSNLQTQISDQSNADSDRKKLQDPVKRFIKQVPDFYSLQAQELHDCAEDECHDLAVETIKNVKRNESAGWVLIALAAHSVWVKTTPLPGGAYKTAAPDQGRMNALEKLAADCLEKGAKVSVSTLYDYVRRIQVLVEDPLATLDGQKEELIAQERTNLVNNLFLVPSSFARAASHTTKPAEALEIALQKLENSCKEKEEKKEEKNEDDTSKGDKSNKITTAQYKESISHLKKDIVDAKGAADSEGEDSPQPVDLDAPYNASSCQEYLIEEDFRFEKSSVTERSSTSVSVDEFFYSQINGAARCANISFDQALQVCTFYAQAQLSIFKNIGVKK